ncbi:MAG: transketolase family protein [Sedimentisphaerales bacterium]|nr:transketolase family protein [Sedimentisphaerales bacterium]
MRNAYLEALYELAGADRRVLALIADNGAIVYDKYRRDYPEQYFNFGISEANMVSVAAGLASCGKIPFAYTISVFLTMRAFEQVRNDVCMQRMNVKLVGTGAGFVYSNLGPTHHATEDLALMRALPGMTIFSPADASEAYQATMAAARMDGPVYLRLATGGSPKIYEGEQGSCGQQNFQPGQAVLLRGGNDLAIVGTGAILLEAIRAADELEREGIAARVINIHTVKPIDREIILRAAAQTGRVITLEEHSVTGGLGSCVAEVLAEAGQAGVQLRRLGLVDSFAESYGSYEQMKQRNGLSKEFVVQAAWELMEN